jgi:hypothetical protein
MDISPSSELEPWLRAKFARISQKTNFLKRSAHSRSQMVVQSSQGELRKVSQLSCPNYCRA